MDLVWNLLLTLVTMPVQHQEVPVKHREQMISLSVLVVASGITLLTAGCGGGGGGGIFGFFGGGSDSGAGDFVTTLDGGTSGSSGGTTSLASDIATVHHPEPASLALFGGGLAGLAGWRRRRAKRTQKPLTAQC